ncbi:MAG: DUF2314 domain-containing protein [Deltaproteobacteria bacterium]|nr:DUF2314 domain-containing protein [Deltaproteobacteria bacterium]
MSRRLMLAALALVVALAGCQRKKSAGPSQRLAPSSGPSVSGAPGGPGAPGASARRWPAGDLLASDVKFIHALYFAPRAKADPQKALTSCKKKVAWQDGPGIVVKDARPPLQEFAPPELDSLRFMAVDVGPDEGKAMLAGEAPLVLSFAAPQAQARAVLRRAAQLMGCVADATGALLWDEATRQVFSRKAWQDERIAPWEGELPAVTHHTVIHFYQEGEANRAVTLGMSKFGLPEIVVNDLPMAGSRDIGMLINLVAQTMLERPTVARDGELPVDASKLKLPPALRGVGKRAAQTLHVQVGEKLQGDADNRLLEPGFDAEVGATLHERQIALLEGLLGDPGEKVLGVGDNDTEMLGARDRARVALAKLAGRFAKERESDGAHLIVKAPFKTDKGDNEWMWVEVTRWKGDRMEGILINEPFHVPTLHEGADVVVSQKTLYDYQYTRAGGQTEGGETDQILLRREQEQGSKATP